MSFMTAETARVNSDHSLFGSTPFWTKGRFSTLMEMLAPLNPDGTSNIGIPRIQVEWNRVANANPAYTILGPIQPFFIPGTYDDPDAQGVALNIVDSDFNNAVDLAMRWKAFNDIAAANKAVAIIVAWSTINSWTLNGTATTPLVWSDRVPKLIQAAMMLKGFGGYTTLIENNFKAMIQLSITNKVSTTWNYNNNVGVWGVCFDIASASLLNNRSEFDRAIVNWRRLFDENITDNIPLGEVYREDGSQGNGKTGLWYSNFLVYAFTMAAEWARFNGEWLYDYTSPDGSTFRGLVEQVRYWTRYPYNFPYNSSGTPSTTVRTLPSDEVTHALWPNEDSEWLLNNFPNGGDRDSIGSRGSVLAYRNRPLYG